MQRRFFKLIAAVLVLFERDGKLLLLLRQNTGYCDQCYGFVGGALDGEETVLQAAVRESNEEVGVIVKPDDLSVVHVVHNRAMILDHNVKVGTSERESIVFFLKTRFWQGEPYNKEPDKCKEFLWVGGDNLPANMVAFQQYAFEQMKLGYLYSEYGWQ